ncbi:uncharacterized protein [Halyomorpha halys]|uniref:uncharacterized protein n=1 Tax=Halyomorpha halys TaxID=286706 RepID=UPI0006D4F7F6
MSGTFCAIYSVALVAAVFISSGVRGFGTGDNLKVVIDTDVGADDAMAIMMMLSKRSKAHIMAVTTVQGTTGVENATLGALLTLKVAQRTEIPVYMGSPQGLIFEQESANIYGYDGLGDTFWKPPIGQRKDGHSALALVNLVKKNPGTISLLCIGPLTNLALAMHIYPQLLLDLKEVVILGGSYKERSLIESGVEFNMRMDPYAATYVFNNVPQSKLITLIPQETVKGLNFDKDWRLKVLGKIDSAFIRFLNKAEKLSLYRKDDLWTPYAQTAASVILDPTIVNSSATANVKVDPSGHVTAITAILGHYKDIPNVKIVTEVSKTLQEDMLLNLMRG